MTSTIRKRSNAPPKPNTEASNGDNKLKYAVKKKSSSSSSNWLYIGVMTLFVTMMMGGALQYVVATSDGPKAMKSAASDNEHSNKDEVYGFTQEVIESSDLSLPKLKPLDIAPFRWKSDGKLADTGGRIIGLPPKLTEEIRAFAVESGLMDLFWKLAYGGEDTPPSGESKIHTLNGGRKWISLTPDADAHWGGSNMHWLDAADEENYEETLQVLKRGGFDDVLEVIGKEFESDGLMVAGMGFMLVSHIHQGGWHADLPDIGTDWHDLLFPLLLPENDSAELLIGDEDDEERVTTIPYTPNVGVFIDGDTWHATGGCDYRKSKGLRVAVSIYVVDVNEDNVELVASDGTALFPVPSETDWLLAQAGRSWGNGKSLKNDNGRRPFSVVDRYPDCAEWAREGKCETDLTGVRMDCLKSCKVYIDDERYFSEFVSSS